MTAPAPSSPADLSLRLRFEAFIEALCHCVAAEGSKHRIAGPLVVLIWTRLRRLAKNFARIVTRPPSHRPEQKSGRSGPRHKLPNAFAWLLRLMPATAAIASQFRHMLDQPEMRNLLATTPEAGRVLRPLCRTLGIRAPDFLSLPPRPRKPRKPRESGDAHRQAPDDQSPVGTAARRKSLPSCLEPRPDNPLWPRMPGSQFFTGIKFRK